MYFLYEDLPLIQSIVEQKRSMKLLIERHFLRNLKLKFFDSFARRQSVSQIKSAFNIQILQIRTFWFNNTSQTTVLKTNLKEIKNMNGKKT